MSYAAAQAAAVAVTCLWLSPLDTRTVLAAASEYVRTTGFGPYDRLVFSHIHQRPFEICAGADERHAEMLSRLAERTAIQSDSGSELSRLLRLIRTFNRETQDFYASDCPVAWTYYYTYVDYQSGLMKVAPVIWVIDALGLSEIHVIVALIVGSWVGIFSLFWLTKRLTGSALVGLASLGVLWFAFAFFGPMLHADFRLNLFNTFGLIAAAQFLCERPLEWRGIRSWAVEIAAALVFAIFAALLLFPRTPSTRLDATVVMACLVAVAVIRRSPVMLRRAILVALMVFAVQWPYRTFSAQLLAPVGAVNTANAEEYKTLSAVQFLNERPSHFGNFILDFNFTWIFDGDYYLMQMSPVAALHHGFPAWGRQFLTETALYHPTELPNAWWRRFLVQFVYHEQMSYGIYRDYHAAATAVVWLTVPLILFVAARGRPLASSWPLLGLVMWEMFGLHTFLGSMHVHAIYILKGVPLLWCALPAVAYLAGRDGRAVVSKIRGWPLPAWPRRRPRARAIVAAIVVVIAGAWAVREYRKEVHATRVWRAVHAGQYHRDAYLSPEELLEEIEAIRRLGGEGPGTVSMFGAWALFGYLERLGAYNALMGQQIRPDHVKQLAMQLYKRAFEEAPGNPHFYPYAKYFEDPDMLEVFRAGLDRFPEHPYAVLMNYFVASQHPKLTDVERLAYLANYDTAVRRQLKASASLRPGLREFPEIATNGPLVETADGMLVTLLPGEVARVGTIRTLGTDRLTVGVFTKVLQGSVWVGLEGQPQVKFLEARLLFPSDTTGYRIFHFSGLTADPASSRTATTTLELRASGDGARFIIRDLYPVIENPRWFR